MSVLSKNTSKESGRSFLDFFPTPKFLEMPSPGLAISETNLKFIEFAHTKNGFVVARHDSLQFTEPLISSGDIKDKEKLVLELKKFKEKNDLHYVRVSLPEEKAYLFTTTLSSEQMENARTSIEFVIEENVPLAVSEAVFDYVVVNSDRSPEDPAKINVSVVSQTVVAEYLEVLRLAGFEPLHFEAESQAIVKAVVPRKDTSVSVILNLSPGRAGFYIADGRAIVFTSTVALTEFPSDKKTPLSAPCLAQISEELKRIYQYWRNLAERNEEKLRPVDKIILVGEDGSRDEVMSMLQSSFDVKVDKGNVWGNVFSLDEYVPAISSDDSLAYVTAVGLAMPRRIKT